MIDLKITLFPLTNGAFGLDALHIKLLMLIGRANQKLTQTQIVH